MKYIFRGVIALLFSTAVITVVLNWFDLPKGLTAFPSNVVVGLGLAFTVLSVFSYKSEPQRLSFFPVVFLVFGTLLFIPFVFVFEVFGTYDAESVLTAMRENPPQEMALIGLGSLREPLTEYAVLGGVIVVGGAILFRWSTSLRAAVILMGSLFIASSPVTYHFYRMIVPNPAHALISLPEDVFVPTVLSRPSSPKNIVFLYLESIERTYRDIPQTEAAFHALAEIEDQGLSFRNLGQVQGTHFTAGGMLATQCGLPLLPRGIVNVHNQIREGAELDVLQMEDFLDHVDCLGDILQADGYEGSYLNGSDLAVFSKGILFNTHGYDRVFGVDSLTGSREERYENVWGMSDETLFSYVDAELEKLASLGSPFMLSALTISTHGPDAELDEDCNYPTIEESRIPAAIYCTGGHVENVLQKLSDLGIADDTIVVVMSDHLAMRNSIYPLLEAQEEQRRNLVVVLGAGTEGTNLKLGTMLDVYPTILELMGYEISEGRANMGVSLLSDQPTLAGRIGLEDLDLALSQNTPLSRFLWDADLFAQRQYVQAE